MNKDSRPHLIQDLVSLSGQLHFGSGGVPAPAKHGSHEYWVEVDDRNYGELDQQEA